MRCIDVAIPCYLYGGFLRECVQSVLRQDKVEVRVLILDDASPDDTPAVAKALVAEDARVSYRRHAANRGHIATYNEGLDWVEADYFLLLSADDVLTPGALNRALYLLEQRPEIGVTFGRPVLTFDPSAEKPDPPGPFQCLQLGTYSWIEKFCSAGQNIAGHHNATAVVRTQVQKKCGHYRAELPHSADMEMWMRLGVQGCVGMVRAKQSYYRQHPGAMHHRYVGVVDLRERKGAFDFFFQEHGRRVPKARQLHQMAHHSLARSAIVQARKAFAASQPRTGRELLQFAWETEPQTFPETAPAWTSLEVACADLGGQT